MGVALGSGVAVGAGVGGIGDAAARGVVAVALGRLVGVAALEAVGDGSGVDGRVGTGVDASIVAEGGTVSMARVGEATGGASCVAVETV